MLLQVNACRTARYAGYIQLPSVIFLPVYGHPVRTLRPATAVY